MADPLDGCPKAEDRQNKNRFHGQAKDQANPEQDHAFRTGEPSFHADHAQGLGPGADIAGEERSHERHHDDRNGKGMIFNGQLIGDYCQEHPLPQPVQGRVKESTKGGCLVSFPGQSAVEHVKGATQEKHRPCRRWIPQEENSAGEERDSETRPGDLIGLYRERGGLRREFFQKRR